MLFNSIEFLFFLPIVFFIYWFPLNNKYKSQNLLIFIASYIFYGWWDWRFLFLIAFSSIVDFCVGVFMSKTQELSKRKILLWISILVNLGFLGFFKYYNFFAESFTDAFTFFGKNIEVSRLNIILPVGISFYTFQTLSYSIDVYRGKLKPTKNVIAFLAFVSFFPQLVAGPIERATNLLPQFLKKRKFDYDLAANGMRQILWGLFKKIVIADNCAEYANIIFNNYQDYNGVTLFIGAVFFSFQIYGDFSGYSDIAIGTSKLFGFNLMQNFATPYFSRDIAEFWRRWHISLSTWFRDYLYIPLGGSRGSMYKKIRNVFIIFLVSGFWHGANWTFIVWGGVNALYFIPLMVFNKNRQNTDVVAQNSFLPSFTELIQMIFTFVITVFAWIFFRSYSVGSAFEYIKNIFIKLSLENIYFTSDMLNVSLLILFFLVVEWLGRFDKFAISILAKLPTFFRWSFYFTIVILLFVFTGKQQAFIYFQF